MIPDSIAVTFKETSTRDLVTALINIDALGADLNEQERTTRAWLIEEIESRHDVTRAMDRWVMNDHSRLTYVEALVKALPDDYADLVGAVS
jgi:hypothetical protein